MIRLFKALIVLVSIALPTRVISQTANADNIYNLKTVLPPSPTAAALGKYTEWPVNLNTGTADISIPLYTLTGRTLEVPISLSYHTSGFRTSEVASWVGLGWSLQAGGVITRTVRGFPDECGAGYFTTREHANFTNKNYTFEDGPTYSTIWKNLVQNAVTGEVDAVQDSYSLSAMGRSYRLLFKRTSSGTEIQTIPHSNVKVTSDIDAPGGGGSWTVTLEDGTILAFGGTAVEFTDNARLQSPCGRIYASAWYLTSITSPTREVVTFAYQASAQSDEMVTSFSYDDWASYLTSGGAITNSGSTPNRKYETQRYTVLNLHTITSATGYVQFYRSATERSDFPKQFALQEMRVYQSGNPTPIDKFTFYTRQWATATSSKVSVPGTHNYADWKMMLDSVKHNGSASHPNPPVWKFTYNQTQLPSTLTLAQDHYGYYNGATSNPHLLPAMTIGPISGNYYTFPGAANRTPNPTYMQAGILTAIQYPTKGSTEFYYEPNQSATGSPTYGPASVAANLGLTPTTNPWVQQGTTTLTISKPQAVTFAVTSSKNLVGDQTNIYVRGEITGGPNTIVVNDNSSSIVNLGVGTYTVRVYTNVTVGSFTTGSFLNASASVSYSAPTGGPPTYTYYGGLRIWSIVDKPDFDEAKNIKRYFEYATPSPYLAVTEPIDYRTDLFEISSGAVSKTKVFRNSSAKISGGSTVSYGMVTTKYGPNKENGYTVSRFMNTGDVNNSGVQFGEAPYPDPDPREYSRSLLRSEIVYSSTDKKLSAKYYTYDLATIQVLYFFKALRKTYYANGECPDPEGYCGFMPIRMTLTNEQIKKVTARETTYVDNGTGTPDTVSVLNTYYYDTPVNTRPTRTVTLDSKGHTRTISEFTVLDLVNIVPIPVGENYLAIYAMKDDLNMVGIVVQRKEELTTPQSTSHVSTMTTSFKRNTLSPVVVVPDSVRSKIGSANTEVRLVFSGYDQNANLLEQYKTNDNRNSYIYDYFSAYPVAEVVGGLATQIAYASFEANGKGNWTYAGNADASNFYSGKLGYSLGGGNVSISSLPSASYKVTWWAKTGAAVSISSGTPTAIMSRRGWTFYEAITGSVTSVTISGTGYIDDLRLYPKDAQMRTATYQPLIGKTSEMDVAGNTVYYEYDTLNRLIAIRDDKGNLVKSINYHYKTKPYNN